MIFAPFAFRNQIRVAAAATTLQYETIGMVGGTVDVFRNGSSIASLTTDTALTSVILTPGDTVQMTLTGGSKLGTFIYYYLNGALQTTYSGTTTISTAVITTSAGNTYYFSYQGSA
jgi:hypothetical protein